MKTSNLILLVAVGGGAVYFLTKKPATTTKKAPGSVAPGGIPAEKVPDPNAPKPGKFVPVDNGFIYNCNTLEITDKEKLKAFVNKNALAIAEKQGLVDTKLLANINVPPFIDEVVVSLNKNCLKNPELMSSDEKVNQVVLVIYHLGQILKELEQKENISEEKSEQIKDFIFEKVKNHYQLTPNEATKFVEVLLQFLPESYTFDCNTFEIHDEEKFELVVMLMFISGLIKFGYIKENPGTLFGGNLSIIVQEVINKLNPNCTIENISDDAFISIIAIVVTYYRLLVHEHYPNDINSVLKSEQKITELYQELELTPEAIQEIEELIAKMDLNPDFEEAIEANNNKLKLISFAMG